MHETAVAELNPAIAPEKGEDAVWAIINLPLSPDELVRYCHQDVERLFRINPYLEFTAWEEQSDGLIHFAGKNSSQEPPFMFDLMLRIETQADGLTVSYENGLKGTTVFKVESSEVGAKLTILENYPPLNDEEFTAHQREIDRSLTIWAGDLQKFFLMWKQWRWLVPWRWYMDKVWKRLKPAGRRITYMFWCITLVEIALITLGVAIFFAEYT